LRSLKIPAALLCALLFSVAIPSAAMALDTCVTGTLTAEFNADPAFPNLWRYCAEVRWDLGQYALSHLDAFLQLPNCDCVCDEQFIRFAQPAGQSTSGSEDEPCVIAYLGEYVCKGDPSLPTMYLGPAVKFEPATSSCEPGVSGYGRFCFYSPMPPQEPTEIPQGLAIKHGQETCYGTLVGRIPSCDCALPARGTTWGSLKMLYH
jgi:hypothetical protein